MEKKECMKLHAPRLLGESGNWETDPGSMVPLGFVFHLNFKKTKLLPWKLYVVRMVVVGLDLHDR